MSALERRPMLSGRLRLSFVRQGTSAWHEISADTSKGTVTIVVWTAELRPLVGAMLKTIAGSLPSEQRESAKAIIDYLDGKVQR